MDTGIFLKKPVFYQHLLLRQKSAARRQQLLSSGDQ